VIDAFGEISLSDFKTLDSGDYGIDYADGNIAIRVYRASVPEKLTDHFYRVANGYRGHMQGCATRACQTIHLGPKEYNPNKKQQPVMEAKRVWRQDKGVAREHTVALLPELMFAHQVLMQAAPKTFKAKMSIDLNFRLAETCFTRAAVNCTNCRLHRDFCVGLDVMMYAGLWKWGGDVVIPQLRIKIVVKPGDIIIMDSGLFHMVTDFHGTRFVVVFFTKRHKKRSKAGNLLLVPENLAWCCKRMFGVEQ